MEEISLRELIETLIKRKKMIIGITVVAIFAAAIFSFFILDPVYETHMVLMASNFADKLQTTQINGEGVDNILNSISNYPSMTLETYRQQIKAPRVMRATIEELGLEEEFDIESLAGKINLETVKDTNMITIKMRDNDPEKAAQIVNKVGEKFVQFVSDKAKEQATRSSSYVESQMAIEKEKLDEVLIEMKEFLSQPRGVAELGMELQAKLDQITNFKTNLTELQIRKTALVEGIKVAENQATNTSRIMIEGQSKNSMNGSSNQSIILEDTETILKIEQAEVNANIKSLEKQIAAIQKEIEELQVELEEKRYQERLINKKVEIAQNTYDAFVKKYEELRVAESSQIGDATITVVSRAYATNKPVAPKKALNVAIAAVLGLMAGVFVAFFAEYWETSSKEIQKTA